MRTKEKKTPTIKLASESKKRNVLCGIAVMLCFAMTISSCNNSENNPDQSANRSAQVQASLEKSSEDTVSTDNVLDNDSNDIIAATATKYKYSVINKVESQTSLTSQDFKTSKRKAFLIGVGNYSKHQCKDKNAKWPDINSLNDIALLQEFLIALDFKVVTLTDEAATHDNIINSLNVLAQKCNKGDTVIVHFSGHGQQMTDTYGDEDDHWTETFIPIDALMKETEDYRIAENHLKDNEINECVLAITNKIKQDGVLIVSLDACHSGGATKGDDTKGETAPNKNRGKLRSGERFQSDELIKLYEAYDPSKNVTPRYSSHFYALSACRSDEPNYEYKDDKGILGMKDREYGSLSFVLCRELANLKKGERIDFEKLTNAVIHHKENNRNFWQEQGQTPVKESNESDNLH